LYKGLLLSVDEHFGDHVSPILVVQCLMITPQAPSQAALQGFASTQSSPADDNQSSLGMWQTCHFQVTIAKTFRNT
jgi:hypothetical protein